MNRRGSAARVDCFDSETLTFDFDINGNKVTISELPKEVIKQFEHWIETSENNFEKVSFITQCLAKIDTMTFLAKEGKYHQAALAGKEAHAMLLDKWAKQLRANLNSRRIGGGGMGFLLSDENLASGFDHKMPEVGIKLAAFEKLCEYNPKWKNVRTAWLHTYPALSYYSVREYTLVVLTDDKPQPVAITKIENCLSSDILEKLRAMMTETDPQLQEVMPLLDGVYLHPEALIASGRDCDADIGFFAIGKKGTPIYRRHRTLPIADNGIAHLKLHKGSPKLPYEKDFDETVTVEEYARRQLEKKGKNRILNRPDPSDFYTAERGASALISGYTVGLRLHVQRTAKKVGWIQAVQDENQEHFAKHTEAIFDQRKVDASVAADAKMFTLQMGEEIRTACENAELFPILACRKKMHENFPQAIRKFATWQDALSDMFDQVSNDAPEEYEFVDPTGDI